MRLAQRATIGFDGHIFRDEHYYYIVVHQFQNVCVCVCVGCQ